jgi:hypothetical protein
LAEAAPAKEAEAATAAATNAEAEATAIHAYHSFSVLLEEGVPAKMARTAVGIIAAVILAWSGWSAAVDQVLHNTATAYVAGAAPFDGRLGGSSACVVPVELMLPAVFVGAGGDDEVGVAYSSFLSASFLRCWQVEEILLVLHVLFWPTF